MTTDSRFARDAKGMLRGAAVLVCISFGIPLPRLAGIPRVFMAACQVTYFAPATDAVIPSLQQPTELGALTLTIKNQTQTPAAARGHRRLIVMVPCVCLLATLG